MELTTIGVTALVTLVVTVLGGMAVEYLKKIKPKIEYSVKEGVPIEIEGKSISASVVSVSNPSSKAVKDIVVKIRSPMTAIKNGGVKATEGLEYSTKEDGDTLNICIPFLKYRDYVSLTVISESKDTTLRKPEVSIRSPDQYKLVSLLENGARSTVLRRMASGFLPGLVAAVGVGFALYFQGNPFTPSARYEQSANLVLAASMAGLPLVAQHYTSTTGVTYYNQGPYIYSLAKASASQDEVRRLRLVLTEVLRISDRMSAKSEAAICFFAGKISAHLGEASEVERWYDRARRANESEFNFLNANFKEVPQLEVLGIDTSNHSLQCRRAQ